MVDDKEAVRRSLAGAGVSAAPSGHLSFRDPWGNHVEVVQYSDIQFAKTPHVLTGMGLDGLSKSPEALEELRAKGLAPNDADAGEVF